MKKVIICFLFLTSQGAFAAQDLSEKLIDLRAEVQSLADQLEAEKKSLSASIQSLTIEKGELESRKKLLGLRNKEMKKALAQKTKIVGGAEVKGLEGHAKIVDSGMDTLMVYQQNAIPFKSKARVAKAKSLKEKFANKEITLAEYLEKYWSFLQDEIRLSESVEVQNDTVQIGDKDYQVKVLKFGMYQMYFKTYEGQIGYARKESGKWVFKFFNDSSSEKGVNLLFTAKEKQIKGGNYNLPIVTHFNNTEIGQKIEKEEVKNVL